MPEIVNEDAAENEDVIVKFSTDGGLAGEDKPPPEAPPPDKPIPVVKDAPPLAPKAGVEELQRALQQSRVYNQRVAEDARRIAMQRDQAAMQRDQAVAYAQDAERRGVSERETAVEQRVMALQAEMDSLTEQQQVAMEGGEWKKVADLNKKLGQIGGDIALFQRDRATLAWEREQAEYQRQLRQQQPQQQPRPQTNDPVEYAAMGKSERTAAFIRAHRDLVRPDGTFKDVALVAHKGALDAGHREDSDGYFKFIEQRVYGQRPAVSAAPGVAPRPTSTAAPVSRAAVSGIPNFDGENLRMTDRMKRLAVEQLPDLPVKEAYRQWAKGYVEGVKSGRMEAIRD